MASESVDLMNQPAYFRELIGVLGSVQRPGYFATGGEVSLPFPALKIEGIPNVISLPLSEAHAKSIISKCSLAPFGRGESTIYDTNVRRSWQLDPSMFTIHNPEWKKAISSLLLQVKDELGCCNTHHVTCQLYKLLLYEPGGFFKPHRDTEKLDGMFGTLVVQLLSDFTGGELIVRNGGKEKRLKFDGLAGSMNFHYSAFYADCQHELTEVTSGYRLCLVYNLVCHGSDSAPTPANNQRSVDTIVKSMKSWNRDASKNKGPEAMVYLMEHKYSEASLSFSALKNVDRAVGDVLLEAQRRLDFDLYLAHVEVTQNYSASCDYYGSFEVVELIEEEVSASFFAAPDSRVLPQANISLSDDVIYPKELFDLENPDDEECEEATGNEGATIDRFYHWTAIILWPVERRLRMIGLNKMTEKLMKMVDESPPRDSKKHKECMGLAQAIVNYTGTTQHSLSASSAAILLQCLQALGDIALIQQLLIKHKVSDFVSNSNFCDQILSLCRSLSVKDVEPILVGLIKKGCEDKSACCMLLIKLFEHASFGSSSTEFLAVCRDLMSVFCDAIVNTTQSSSYYYNKCTLTVSTVTLMLKKLLVMKEVDLLSKFLVAAASSASVPTLVNDVGFSNTIVSISKVWGWNILSPGLTALFKKAAQSSREVAVLCTFLTHLVQSSANTVAGEQKTLCQDLLNLIVVCIVAEKERGYIGHWEQIPADFTLSVLKLILTLDQKDSLSRVVTAFLRQPNRYPLLTLVENVLKAYQWAGAEKGAALGPAAISVKAAIEAQLSRPQPKGRSKKATKERNDLQKLSLFKDNLVKVIKCSKSSPGGEPSAKRPKTSGSARGECSSIQSPLAKKQKLASSTVVDLTKN